MKWFRKWQWLIVAGVMLVVSIYCSGRGDHAISAIWLVGASMMIGIFHIT